MNAHPSHLGISSPCTPALPPIHDCKPLFPPRASRNPSHLLSVPRLPHHLEARTARLLAVGLRCGIACCATLNAPFTLVPPTIEAAPTPAALPASLPTAALASLLVAPLHAAAVLPTHTPTDFLASSWLVPHRLETRIPPEDTSTTLHKQAGKGMTPWSVEMRQTLISTVRGVNANTHLTMP